MLGKIFSRRHFEIFSYFPKKIGFDVSCRLSPMEIICMECQILFSGGKLRKRKSIICRMLNLPRACTLLIEKPSILRPLVGHKLCDLWVFLGYFFPDIDLWHFNIIISMISTHQKQITAEGNVAMKIKIASVRQNQQHGMCAQRRFRSAWASAQSDQSLRFTLYE